MPSPSTIWLQEDWPTAHDKRRILQRRRAGAPGRIAAVRRRLVLDKVARGVRATVRLALVGINVAHVVHVVDFARANVFQRDLGREKEIVRSELNGLGNFDSAGPRAHPRGAVELVPGRGVPCGEVLDMLSGLRDVRLTRPLLIMRFSWPPGEVSNSKDQPSKGDPGRKYPPENS